MEALVYDRFFADQSEQFCAFRALCRAAGPHSVVGLVPASNGLCVFVGLLGDYQGMINVPAQTSGFPNEEMFRLGHLIVLKKSGIVRMLFMEALKEFAERYGIAFRRRQETERKGAELRALRHRYPHQIGTGYNAQLCKS